MIEIIFVEKAHEENKRCPDRQRNGPSSPHAAFKIHPGNRSWPSLSCSFAKSLERVVNSCPANGLLHRWFLPSLRPRGVVGQAGGSR
jgi:hypothetical protein